MITLTSFLYSDYLSNIAALSGSEMILSNHPFLLISFILFIATFSIQLFYYLFIYLTTALFKHPESNWKKEPVSVIICARNEEENLRKFLPAVLEQNYYDYEIVVVNDCSEDDSYNVLGNFLKKYPHLKVSNIIKDTKFTHNKKFAQFIGIKAAKNEILLFTDADCKPDTEKWIERMASGFDEKISLVLGYGGYFSKPGILNKYIRFDSMTIAMQYLGLAIKGKPYMGVGRNLAYRRSLFFDKGGFGSYSHIVSGDDDLFVNSNSTLENCIVEFRKESHTRSEPETSLSKFFKQKKRHLTTAKYYKTRDKIILFTEPLTRVLLYSSFTFIMANLYLWPAALSVMGVRIIIQYLVYILVQKRLNEKGLLPYVFIFDILSPFINGAIYISSLRLNTAKNRWK